MDHFHFAILVIKYTYFALFIYLFFIYFLFKVHYRRNDKKLYGWVILNKDWGFNFIWSQEKKKFSLFFSLCWLIDFNSMSTGLGLFYAERLRNHIQCTFISNIFLCSFLKIFFCTLSYWMQKSFEQIYFTQRWGTLTSTTTLCQSETGSNSNEGVIPHSLDLQNWSLTFRCSLVPHLRYSFFWWGKGGRFYPSAGSIVTIFYTPLTGLFFSLIFLH